jgi:hypothetical protein
MVVIDQNATFVFQELLNEWGAIPYSQLSLVLVYLKFLQAVHQNHHWIARSDTFYSDHLLFDRLYQKTVEEIDKVAEKAVGKGDQNNVNLPLITAQCMRLVAGYGMTSTIPQSTELASRSLLAELNFLTCLDLMILSLRDVTLSSQGIENMLQGLYDSHEENVYLLKQRVTPGP